MARSRTSHERDTGQAASRPAIQVEPGPHRLPVGPVDAGFGLAAWLAVPDAPTASTSRKMGSERTRTIGPETRRLPRPDRCRISWPIRIFVPTDDHPLLGRQSARFRTRRRGTETWRLRELQDGRPVVLIFYYGFQCAAVSGNFSRQRRPAAFPRGGRERCRHQCRSSEMTRQRFQKYGRFSFPVLADPGNKVAKAYQVFREDSLRHGTFILDPNSTVRWVNLGDSPIRRNRALLCQLSRLGK